MFLQVIKSERNVEDINIKNAKRIAQTIKKLYPVATIYITGSVLKPHLVHPGSDIDIVTMNIEEKNYEALIKHIRLKFPSLNADIRRMEELDSYLKHKVMNKGYLVYYE